MFGTRRLLASALCVLTLSILGTRVAFPAPPGGPKPIQFNCDPDPGTPDYCAVQVIGVQKRSACDIPNEWWVQAKNTSTMQYFRVVIQASVVSFEGNTNPLCTVAQTDTFDLAPAQCDYVHAIYPNPQPERPCDSQCCKDNSQCVPGGPCINGKPPGWYDCVNCTKIIDATAKVIAWKPDAQSAWQDVQAATVCAIANGSANGINSTQCRVINTCDASSPHYKDWSIAPCQPGL